MKEVFDKEADKTPKNIERPPGSEKADQTLEEVKKGIKEFQNIGNWPKVY